MTLEAHTTLAPDTAGFSISPVMNYAG